MIVLALTIISFWNSGFHTQQYWIFESSTVFVPITWSYVGKPTSSGLTTNIFPYPINFEFSPNGNAQIDAMIYVLGHEVKKVTNPKIIKQGWAHFYSPIR